MIHKSYGCDGLFMTKGYRTMALDDGSVLCMKVYVCSGCNELKFELEEKLGALPPYME